MEDFNTGRVNTKPHLRTNLRGVRNVETLVALLLSVTCFLPMTSSLSISVNPGLYYEEQVPAIFYDHYIPAIVEYKTPKMNKTELTFNNWFNCTSEKYPYSLSCPVVFHLNAAVRNLHRDFGSIQPGKDDEEFSHAQHFNLLSNSKNFCNKIQKHFPGIYTNVTDIRQYFKDLQKCANKYPVDWRNVDYQYDIRSPFSKMEYNFYSTFFQPVTNRTGDIRLLASASLSNSRTAIQGSVMASFYAERNRWNFAVATCFQNKLPPSLVTQDKLEEILGSIDGDAHITSISNDSISKYFSLPLTDCTHTNDEFIVRLLIPMISSSREKYRLISVHPIQFQVGNTFCALKSSKGPSMYLFDVEQQLAFKSICEPNELCDLNSHTEIDLCMSAIFAKNVTGMLTFCQYKCEEPSQPFRIEMVAKNAFTITADKSTSVKVTCPSKNPESASTGETLQGPGTFLIEVLSLCDISASSGSISVSVRTNVFSNDSVVPYFATHAVPLNFLKEEFRVGNESSPGIFEIEVEDWGFLDEDYLRRLLGTSSIPESPMAQVQNNVSSNHTGLYLYITFLSFLVVALVICQYLLLKRVSILQGTSILATFQGDSVNITTQDSALLMEECEYTH
ncbi:unnamed protein product [Allacma fusca]|uniref:Uncharacterized protein n=1 Tax=Allacma fusca TaxID=39272 RepID=A0A8J2PZL8_9HEXA|nr:unnamed protein product [Allacma fusca]